MRRVNQASSPPKSRPSKRKTLLSSHPPVSRTALELWQEQEQQQQYTSLRNFHRLSLLPLRASSPSNIHAGIDAMSSVSWLQLGVGLHELAGEAGSGKTQIALSVCMDAATNTVLLHDDVQRTSSTMIPRLSNPACCNDFRTNPPALTTITNRDLPTLCSGSCRAIYLSLKGTASLTKILQRLQQMAHARLEHSPLMHPTPVATNMTAVSVAVPLTPANYPLDRILTRAVVHVDDLFHLLYREMPALLNQHPHVQIVVLDCLADLFRGYGATDHSSSYLTSNNNVAHHRAAMLFRLAALLKQYSDLYKIPFLVLNQITDTTNGFSIPALGLSWSHCVNRSYRVRRHEQCLSTDVVLDSVANQPERTNPIVETTKSATNIGCTHKTVVEQQSTTSFRRTIYLIKSPEAPSCLETNFVITARGVMNAIRNNHSCNTASKR